MVQSTPSVCPRLGMVDDSTVLQTTPNAGHRCYAQVPPGSIDATYQRAYCLTAGHKACPFYAAAATETSMPSSQRSKRWQVLLPAVAVVVMIALVGFIYGRDLTRSRRTTAGAGVAVAASANPEVAPAAPTPGPSGKVVNAVHPAATRFATPTPEAGGRTVTLSPSTGDAGWWSSSDTRGSHLGDSFLHAGYFDGKVFISAAQLDLRGVPRGAPLREAIFRLSALQDARLDRKAGGTWTVQFLAPDAIGALSRADFQKLFNAPSAVTLFPSLQPGDLQLNSANTWVLDASGREWLKQQLDSGVPGIVVRILGPVGGSPTLFTWDSGSGPASNGELPQLVLGLGPAPSTPPALPSRAAVVAIPTATPANVLTAAAQVLEATRIATTTGTFTPVPMDAVTPTPMPANVATAMALRSAEGFPIVIYTPVPANQATAKANAAYATAVALTTGTFTPVPTNAVTPVMVMPTPMPENVVTAAAQSVAATARAVKAGTATPLPPGALIATVTPGPYVIIDTATPANAATAAYRVAYATAVALTTGTFTPMPPGGMRPTATPSDTPLPLIVPSTPKPTVTPTPTAPAQIPTELRGKILFLSDRDGSASGQLYALDPATGALSWITQPWPRIVAQAVEGLSPDGNLNAAVEIVTTSKVDKTTNLSTDTQTAQLFVSDKQYNTKRQLTHTNRYSYDPAWSPKGDWIAFVNQDPGNDEILLIRPDGSETRRLTNTTWEWNKHPSWSPDGSQIVFWSNRVTGRKQLWIMNADGTSQRPLLESGFNDWDPIWVK